MEALVVESIQDHLKVIKRSKPRMGDLIEWKRLPISSYAAGVDVSERESYIYIGDGRRHDFIDAVTFNRFSLGTMMSMDIISRR